MGLTFGGLRSRVGDLAGFDLSVSQRDELLNEGHREIAIRSEWYRDELELGPATAGVSTYNVPANVARILELQVAGYDYHSSDRGEVGRLTRGETSLLSGVRGLWWDKWNAGQRQIGLYPTPAGAETLDALVILRPEELTDADDEPVVPAEYRNAIVDYAASIYYGDVEDNAELRSFHQDQFDRKVAELRRLVTGTGRGVVQWKAGR